MAKKVLDKVKKVLKPAKLAGKKASKKGKKAIPELGAVKGTSASLAWVVLEESVPMIIDRKVSEYYILVLSADDQKTIQEYRNTGKTVGETYYADQAKPGIQGDEVILVLRK